MNNLSVSQEASSLRAALRSIENPAELSHTRCLDIVAQQKGSSDWNTYIALQKATYFWRLHEPLFPCSPERAAATTAGKAFAIDQEAMADNDDVSMFQLRELLKRMQWQCQQIERGSLKVAGDLAGALNAAKTSTRQQLLRAESAARRGLPDWLSTFASRYSEPVNRSAQERARWKLACIAGNPSEYSEAYARWRLATLARALHDAQRKPSSLGLEALLDARADIYTLIAAVISAQFGPIDTWTLEDAVALSRRPDVRYSVPRRRAKIAFLAGPGYFDASQVVAYASSCYNEDMNAADAKVAIAAVNSLFPELEALFAWTELKALYAPAADKFWKERA